jgi:hypothetical protein
MKGFASDSDAARRLRFCSRAQTVHVIGLQHAAPNGCQEFGPVHLSGSSLFKESLARPPNHDRLREMTLARGGDTLHCTGVFLLRGVA